MLTELLGIKHPLVQAPMLGVTTPDMVAAVSNLGALGSLPIGGLAPEKASELIRATTMKTTRPFAVNLFAHAMPAQIDERVLEKTQQLLQQLCTDYNIPFTPRKADDFTFYWHHRLSHEIRVLWAAHVNHHSSTTMNLATALRQSWAEQL